MATTKNTRTARRSNVASFGLLANGSSGPWEIAIDETTSGPDRFYAQIEGPSATFYFEIPSVDIVGKMVRFLEPHQVPTRRSSISSLGGSGWLVIGKDKKTPITLVKDDEYEDRFFLLVGPMDSPIVRFVIAGTDVVKIADALRQIEQDLDDDD
jgi:hypothetical protein